LAPAGERFEGFVHVAGGRLRDGHGEPVALRGVGLGNWLLPEGYMWKFEPGGPLSGRAIEACFAGLVGPERAAEFWRGFRDRFVTEADIARIAAEGFDHVRLPLNARLLQDQDTGAFLAEGFAIVDRTIDWCRAHGLWVVLDLHGAPGGQTGTNIDDSPNGIPELFGSEAYTKLTVDLWREIAARYADETVVAAYDLLNEPLPNEYQYRYADELVALYRRLTAAIREVDEKHVIMYEGTHWATNWDVFTEVWDANSVLQCHKYWSPPDLPSVRRFVERGRELGLPVYMGETGENNVDWLQAAFQLYDDCGMSWNLWPWKKIETLTSPCSVNAPDGWHAIVAFARGIGPRPAPDDAWRTLVALLDAFDVDACTYRADVVSAVFRRAPLRLAAWAFGFRGRDISYAAAGGSPLPGFRADEGVTIRCATLDEGGSPPFGHTDGSPRAAAEEITVVLQPGDWVAYAVSLAADADVRIGVCAPAGTGALRLLVDGVDLPADRDGAGVFGGRFGAGVHDVRVVAGDAPAELRWLDITLA
jgi:endoglucanase